METPQRFDERGGEERRIGDRRRSRTITPHLGTPIAADDRLGFPLRSHELDARVREALSEDGAFGDVTTIACIRSDRRAHAAIIARAAGVISGVPLAVCAFRLLDPDVAIRVDVDDGAPVTAGGAVMRITGLARAMLSAERVALNFLQRLSGISTLTARYVDAIRGTGAAIVDTRKTIPGFRALEKYAVRAAGATNDRLSLAETVVIKDNHLAAAGRDIAFAVRRVREYFDHSVRVEVECTSVRQVGAALDAGADIILIDGFSLDEIRDCAEIVAGRAALEVSGPLGVDGIRAVANAGAQRVSVAALTQAAQPLDLTLTLEPS